MTIKLKIIITLLLLLVTSCSGKTPQERQREMIEKYRNKYNKHIADSVVVETVSKPCDSTIYTPNYVDTVIYNVHHKDTTVYKPIYKQVYIEPAPIRHKVERKQPKIKYVTYKVVKGDTYFSIAKRYNVTVKQLTDINGKAIKAGQQIKIPVDN